MDKILEKMVRDKVFTVETKEAIAKAFEVSLNEAKVEQEKSIRADLAEQYENDKKSIYAGFESYLEQELLGHVSELRESVDEINKMKIDYAKKSSKLKEDAKAYVKKRLGAMEQVIESVIKKEIEELHESEVANRQTYINVINNKTAELEEDRQKFRKHAAVVLENIINVQVSGALSELKEDIKSAREDKFGREIFEAFMTTYRRQFFDTSKEFRTVVNQLKEAKSEIDTVKKQTGKVVAEAKERAMAAEIKASKLEESVTRSRMMAKLLSPLKGRAREQMKTILESTKTADMQKSFRRYVSEVTRKEPVGSIKESSTRSKMNEALMEIKTGGHATKIEESDSEDDEIMDIRRRAGNAK